MQDDANIRSLKGADCWTYQAFLRSKMHTIITPPARKTSKTVKLPKLLHLAKLKDPEVQRGFRDRLSGTVNSTTWETTRDQICSATNDGLVSSKIRDWFDENDEVIKFLRKKNLRERLLQNDHPDMARKQLDQQFREAKSSAQRRLREIKDCWWAEIAAETQVAADSDNNKVFYSLIKKAFGPKTGTLTPLRAKDRIKLLTSMAETSKRWKQHISERLNRDSVSVTFEQGQWIQVPLLL